MAAGGVAKLTGATKFAQPRACLVQGRRKPESATRQPPAPTCPRLPAGQLQRIGHFGKPERALSAEVPHGEPERSTSSYLRGGFSHPEKKLIEDRKSLAAQKKEGVKESVERMLRRISSHWVRGTRPSLGPSVTILVTGSLSFTSSRRGTSLP